MTENGTNEGKLHIEIARELHTLFLQGMEERYKEVLSFLGIVIPAVSGFIYLVEQYETAKPAGKPLFTLFLGTLAIIGAFVWGAWHTLAGSYRYRYLQASVYKIEQACGANKYIPVSFKPKPYKGFWQRMGFSIAPGIMQVHLGFFVLALLIATVGYGLVAPWKWQSFVILGYATFCLGTIIVLGTVYYPNKINALLANLEKEAQDSGLARRKIVFVTGPSGVGKSALRNYYCTSRSIQPISAITTRRKRAGETEIHRTVTQEQFKKMRDNGALCLVAENHGSMYGYEIKSFWDPDRHTVIIEVDSRTAIEEASKYSAHIIRVVSSSNKQTSEIIKAKSDGVADRQADFGHQASPEFIEQRRKAGDIIFTNNYDDNSLNAFVGLIDSLGGR
ncbi:MAG: hypothetical protein ACYC64_06865 [Armatimonadota bacterium]